MAAVAHTGLVSQLLQHLPRRLLGALDAWSHGVAKRRAEQRIRRWQRRLPSETDSTIEYRLKPWRD
ncbi:MAG TPA: hypothetical protein VHL79_06185 [Ramlibacter sp.]|jgi:hypothetical protein|nr:hypothetical protein [Ramlibacter sp.]